MTPSNTPADQEQAEYARNREARETRRKELAALIAERKAQQQQLEQEPTKIELPRQPWQPVETAPPTATEIRIMEIEGTIAVFQTKLTRKKKPLQWARRQAMMKQVAELKAELKQLKASR